MQPALKTRLIGAAVLIALVVIVAPLFFPSEPSTQVGSRNISLAIPAAPDQALQTRTLSVAPPPASTAPANEHLARVDIPSRVPAAVEPVAPAQPATSEPQGKPETSSPTKPDKSQPKPAVSQPPPAAKPAPAKKPAEPGRAAHARYVVSLGTYTHKASAEHLMTKARAMGYAVEISGTEIGGKPAARVEVGPFATRAAGEAARLKLHAALPQASAKLLQAVSDQKGDAPAKALPADRAGGWAVQVVAYSRKSDAQSLQARLRKAGFDGYVDAVTDADSGHTLWRVRVGPRPQRSEALSLRDQVQAKFPKLHGVVVTVP